MTPEQLQNISVIEPLSPAIQRVKAILFKPFELSKWFTIGFCAWLAQLGRGGFNFNFRVPFRGSNHPMASPGQFQNFFAANLPLIVILGSTVFVIALAVFITFLWLSSRGRFMFLHCVAQNKAEVKFPWSKFRQHGNSLFLFRLIAGLIFFLFLILFIGAIILFVALLHKNSQHLAIPLILAIIFLSLITIPAVIAFALLFKFTDDFVVPIMYLRSTSCIGAWREFWTLLTGNKARFTLYILFQILIAMAIGAIVFAAILLTLGQ